jgi:MFS family permease
MLAIGMALTVVGAGLQVLSPGTTATIALMCVTAVGQSVAFPNVASLITRTADPHRQGQILGLNNACGALARVVGPFCAGLIFPININGPFLMGAIVVIPAIFLAISASRRATKLQA